MSDTLDSPARLLETIAAYDACAENYSVRYRSVDFTHKISEFVRALPPTGDPVLDAGCGPGRDTAAFAAQGVPGIGLDRSLPMLKIAQRAAGGAQVVQADMRSLPFRDCTLAGIWQCASLLHLSPSEARSALVEAHRTLVFRGALFISVAHGSGSEWRVADGGFRRWFHYYEPNTIEQLLQSAGLTMCTLQVEPGVVHGKWINVLARKD